MFELKSIDQALYNTGLLLPKAKYSLGIFINLVLWQHIVDDDDDGNDDDEDGDDDDDNDVVEDGDDDDVEGHQKGERRLVSTEPKLPPIKSPLGKVTPPMHPDDD